MSADTERAIVLRERAAAARARCHALWLAEHEQRQHHCLYTVGGASSEADECAKCIVWAELAYPLPQRQTVRYEPDPHNTKVRWFVGVGGGLFSESVDCGHWYDAPIAVTPTPERIALWSSLLARPFTLVDDDGGTT